MGDRNASLWRMTTEAPLSNSHSDRHYNGDDNKPSTQE